MFIFLLYTDYQLFMKLIFLANSISCLFFNHAYYVF